MHCYVMMVMKAIFNSYYIQDCTFMSIKIQFDLSLSFNITFFKVQIQGSEDGPSKKFKSLSVPFLGFFKNLLKIQEYSFPTLGIDPSFGLLRLFSKWFECTSFEKISSNPKIGIFSGTFFASIPTLNRMFCINLWNIVTILIFHKIHKELFCFCFEMKGGCVTDKLTFWQIFSKHAQYKEIRYVTSQSIPIFGFALIFLKEVRSSDLVTSQFVYCLTFLRHIHFSNNVSIFFSNFAESTLALR